MLRGALIGAAALLLSGCVTADEIMESYVGKPVYQGILDRGPPDLVMDLPDGRRALQWRIDSSYKMPTTTTGHVNIYAPPGAFANVNHTQTTYGGNTINQTCRYTMYARWDEAQATWVFVGFDKPRFDCL